MFVFARELTSKMMLKQVKKGFRSIGYYIAITIYVIDVFILKSNGEQGIFFIMRRPFLIFNL